MKKCLSFLLAVLLLLATAGCAQKEPSSVNKTNFQMDTLVQITLYDWTDETTIDLAFQEISRLEALLSVEKEGSDLDRLTKAAGKEWVDISPETEEVLRQAKEYTSLSGGIFDVTAGPLIDLWGIHNGEGHYPTKQELAEVLPLIGSDDLLVEDGKAYLAREGMKANLGAIAKGYIADKVKALLIDQGVEHAVLDLGRNILMIGGKPDDTEFKIGVQDPNQEDGKLIGVVAAKDKSVVTSGVYERFFTYNGQKYHHILNPFTGFPAEDGVASVTIISDTSVQGDALSTTCLLLGQEKGLELVERLENVEAMFVLSDGTMVQSSGYSAYSADEA